MAYLERQGYYSETVCLDLIKSLVSDGANLLAPENVKEKIARHRDRGGYEITWKDITKMLASYAYDPFRRMEGTEWISPRYRQGEMVLYVPDEKDLDQLISPAHSKRMATFLQTLRETFADPVEILRAEWIDLKDDALSINTAALKDKVVSPTFFNT